MDRCRETLWCSFPWNESCLLPRVELYCWLSAGETRWMLRSHFRALPNRCHVQNSWMRAKTPWMHYHLSVISIDGKNLIVLMWQASWRWSDTYWWTRSNRERFSRTVSYPAEGESYQGVWMLERSAQVVVSVPSPEFFKLPKPPSSQPQTFALFHSSALEEVKEECTSWFTPVSAMTNTFNKNTTIEGKFLCSSVFSIIKPLFWKYNILYYNIIILVLVLKARNVLK